jgi:hypothetical protein
MDLNTLGDKRIMFDKEVRQSAPLMAISLIAFLHLEPFQLGKK